MITEIHPALPGLRPPAPAVAAANAGANRPTAEDLHALAGQLRNDLLTGGQASAPGSLPGLGGHLDLYDTVGRLAPGRYGGGRTAENQFRVLGEDFDQGLASFEPVPTPHDFPYLKPLAEANLGNRLNTLS